MFSAIQEGLDKANEHATSRAQMVGIPALYQAELPLIKTNIWICTMNVCILHTWSFSHIGGNLRPGG